MEETAHLRTGREEGEEVREKEEGKREAVEGGRRGRGEQGRAGQKKEYKGRELGSNPFPCVDIVTLLPGTRCLFLEGPSPFGLEIQVSY